MSAQTRDCVNTVAENKKDFTKKRCSEQRLPWCQSRFESVFKDGSGKMSVSRGKVHTYLGMKLDYLTPGQVVFSLFDYVDEIIAAFERADPSSKGTKTSAAPDNLFPTDDDCEKLPPHKAVEFHNLVAKTLCATKRACPDTGTAIAFLTTRVRAPDKQDWTKLAHLIKYLRGTKDLPLILSANGSGILKWWVDAAFAVQPNMQGHLGGGVSLGRGFPITSSTKQKLNTCSSTKTEVVANDNFMPAICWTRYFLESQGYQVKDNVLHQDNKSAMLFLRTAKHRAPSRPSTLISGTSS